MIDADVIPAEVRALMSAWIDAGRPTQPGIPWPRDRWISAFPDHAHVFAALPDRLDRDVVRGAVGQALAAGEVVEAFLPPMAWGFGTVGYGPHRVAKMLDSRPDIPSCLAEAARYASQGRALDAYRALGGPNRVPGLGPAFGTKFLYFTSPLRGRALILDKLMANALQRTASILLNPVPWDQRTYGRYLGILGSWARSLDVEPDQIEQVLFRAQASRNGSQWA